MLRRASVVVVLSEPEKNIIENRWQNLNVRVLENAVLLPENEGSKIKKNEKTIIFLGRFHESKGLYEIIEACRILKNENFAFRFNAFGAGDLEDFFTAEMRQILGENFFYGGVIRARKRKRR